MKIGVFDSGLGGLTVVKALSEAFNSLDIVYIADSLYAPYGLKSKEEILNRCIKITDFLMEKYKISTLVVACNTATSAAIMELRLKYPTLKIIGTEPGLKVALTLSKTKNIGVLATKSTLEGQKYQALLKNLVDEEKIKLFECACIGLVEQIEKGKIQDKNTFSMLENWLKPMKENAVDTIVLGCTHYPLIKEQIKKIMGANINIVQTGKALATRVKSLNLDKIKEDLKGQKLEIYHTGFIHTQMIEFIFKNSKIKDNITIRECEI